MEKIKECEINGERMQYDGASESDLETAKSFYKKEFGWKYIGSSRRTFNNGTENNWEKLHHFFVKTRETF